ncbi:MAG TPA: AraC family transcriptional regulator, partial [Lachnospiraceae bacterium]|nr:AraC family transcriptional regulator [Lachnospiraceae bacterium]
MVWMSNVNQSLHYMEENLTNKIGVEDVTNHVFASSSHFQRIFNLVTGFTIGEYIRNRRLSLAGRELLDANNKVIDIAMKYQYDTPESFSKAFSRFHGINPSDVKVHRDSLKYFYPLTIRISIQGGFDMIQGKMNEFYWNNMKDFNKEEFTAKEKYQIIVNWSLKARCQNPGVFDELTVWILDDTEWSSEKLEENEQILMRGVLARFKEQNAQLRACLKQLEPSGVVNQAVYKMIDRFDRELSGIIDDERLQEAVTKVFADFSSMQDRHVRELIAGNKTGPTGTDSVELFGYINRLKESDASVQWTLFMPDEVERKQTGFQV